MLIKTLSAIALFAAFGAAIGYSKILCAGGECAITGTPYGGAFIGGMVGFALITGLNPGQGASRPPKNDSNETQDPTDPR